MPTKPRKGDQQRQTADKQRKNSGAQSKTRDENGRFASGNPHAFKPGQSGNLKGRPRSITLSEAYRRGLALPFPDDPEGRTYAEVIADAVIQSAAMGNVKSAREIADRTEGKPRQSVELDVTLLDWRELAKRHGLKEEDVIGEAQHIIQSVTAAGSQEPDCQEG